MADNKPLEREYIINLRRQLLLVPIYERSGRAIKAIKKFIARHMKVPERDLSKVRLDVRFNNEVWYRGRASPPTKVKVKATREGDIVRVTFADTPAHVKFDIAKHERRHQKSDSKKEVPKEQPKEEKTAEQKKDEEEKGKSTAEANVKIAESASKAQKHTTKVDKAQHPQRMALQK
ncbi:MAG: 50S ribosomal protein L31e [archaeon]